MRTVRAGISFFEVTMVVLIIGIMVAVATPRFSESFQHGKLAATANQIAGHIDYIRRVAVNEGKTTTFHCDGTRDRYYSGEVPFTHDPSKLIRVDIKTEHHSAFELVADFDGHTSLSFDLEGVPHVGSAPLRSGTVTVFYGDHIYDVHIAAGTGETTVTPRVTKPPESDSESELDDPKGDDPYHDEDNWSLS